MTTASITFTFPPDAIRLAYHSQLLPTDWKQIWCVEKKYSDMPTPDNVTLLIGDFPRSGEERKHEATIGMKNAYLEVEDRYHPDCLLKLNSDVALFRPEAWTAPIAYSSTDYVYIRKNVAENRSLCDGLCYAMSAKAIHRLREHFYPTGFPPALRANEDLAFSVYFNDINLDITHCQLDRAKIDRPSLPYTGKDILCSEIGHSITVEADVAKVNAILQSLDRPSLTPIPDYEQAIRNYIGGVDKQ